MSQGFSANNVTLQIDLSSLNAATGSLYTFTSSTNTQLTNIYASESNYVLTSSFINIGHYSGSGGTLGSFALFSASFALTQSILYQSGSGTGSAVLINKTTGSGSAGFQIYTNTYFSGSIIDSTQTAGAAGQTLVAGANGVVWIATASLASLNTLTGSLGTISGSISGSGGTLGNIALFTSSFALTQSIIFQSGSGTGTVVTVGNSTSLLPSSVTNNFQVSGGAAAIHFLGGSKLPTINTNGKTGAGTSPVVTITGSDAAGIINVSSSTSPAGNAVICNVTFSMAYPNSNMYINLTPRNTLTANIPSGSIPFVTNVDSTHFSISSSATALSANTIYSWFYVVIG